MTPLHACLLLVISMATATLASSAQTPANGANTGTLNGYLPPQPPSPPSALLRSAGAGDAHLNVRLLTNAISSVLAEQQQTPSEEAIMFPSDDDDTITRFGDAFSTAGVTGITRKDDRFETLSDAHLEHQQENADRVLFGVEWSGGVTTAETTTRRYIEGLPAEDEDYETIEGSSVDGDRIDPNLIKTLLG